MKNPVSITALASVSPLGASLSEAWESYANPCHLLKQVDFDGRTEWGSPLPDQLDKAVREICGAEPMYRKLDRSVSCAIFAARKALKMAGWEKGGSFGINIGSSRGATGLFEKYYRDFLKGQRSSTLASPTTTLGNISSWVAHDLQTAGPEISHSITCSTALHALLNGVAWLRSGMADKFMVGGSEAPLTAFTIAQMKALKIYAPSPADTPVPYPCRAMDVSSKANTMVLGEGASLACLESGISNRAIAIVDGLGYSTEILEHNVSISADAVCFQRSMKMALGDLNPDLVDVIVLHAPGTVKGDKAEYRAVEKVFGKDGPALTTNKWKVGHTFGASGMLSIEMAILMLCTDSFLPVPYLEYRNHPKKIRRVMVNAVGFGGNAVSVLLKSAPGRTPEIIF